MTNQYIINLRMKSYQDKRDYNIKLYESTDPNLLDILFNIIHIPLLIYKSVGKSFNFYSIPTNFNWDSSTLEHFR